MKGRYARQLGDAAPAYVGPPLTQAQVQDLLTRNPSLQAAVLEFNAGGWFNTYLGLAAASLPGVDFLAWLATQSPAIPANGYYLQDAVYGMPYVVIYPDATGVLHFVPSASIGGASAVPTSALAGLTLPSLGGIGNAIGSISTILTLGAWVLGAVAVAEVVKEIRSARS